MKLWFSRNKVGLMSRGMPTLFALAPEMDRDGYPNGKVEVIYGQSQVRGVDPNTLHEMVSAVKEMAGAGPLTVEQRVRQKAGLPADPPPEEHDGEDIFE